MIINRGKSAKEIAERYIDGAKKKPGKKPPDGNKGDETPPQPPTQQVNGSYLLTFEKGDELIKKTNELFKDTAAAIPLQTSGEAANLYILKRLALITTLSKNLGIGLKYPITPLQSEQLLKGGRLPDPSKYWEDLALLLYDRNGTNPKEAKALYESLKRDRDQLGLSESDLENRLLVINPGIRKDTKMPHGVKPIVLPGITQAYVHPVLGKTGENHKFKHGLEYGLPRVSELGDGDRTLYMPTEDENIGLRVLVRDRLLGVIARSRLLASSSSDGRVNFAL
jgi:hypothetical protein